MKVLRFAPLALAVLLAAACSSSAPQGSAKSQLSFGAQMAQRGLWNEALFRFRQAEQMGPSNPRVWNNLAVAYEATGNYEEALKSYRKALELAPGELEIKRNYSRFVEFYQSFRPNKDAKDAKDGKTAEPAAPVPPPAVPPAPAEKPPGARRSA
jgi:Tfp pilus assembly protein PilF